MPLPAELYGLILTTGFGRDLASYVSDKISWISLCSGHHFGRVFDGQEGFEVLEISGWFLLPFRRASKAFFSTGKSKASSCKQGFLAQRNLSTEHAAYSAVVLEATPRRRPTIRGRRGLSMEGATSGDRAAAAVPARMTTVSRHYFGGGASESDHDLRVDIVEVHARPTSSLPPESPSINSL
jgi:hypothetical protein